ncbi:hypothetical protein GCM10008171_34780 [Methylopila jiangsuensis]|uniref:DUF3016 domain-containing protein n=1 Tax=Methylopila jiangsuensis TaxID=586230 RepID=A0A9W6JLB1_9HYPH|nr:DUF3016 domain-containing protein [Methylopila jiangsuensis]MDR6284391.1 hypothetical protein [Methylopila jiangsuensis]GLK78224.1 hypothetical protein GCM10008171_34780 [Methylopila jiangsuensis]
MRSATALLALALLACPASAHAAAVVTSTATRTYDRDAFRSQAERDANFRDLARDLQRRLDRRLPAGRDVRVELLKVRPAGRFEPWRTGMEDVRVLRDVTPPRIELRYEVRERGRVVAASDETVTDMNYLSNPSSRLSSDRLAHEKALLADWADQRLIRLRPPRH